VRVLLERGDALFGRRQHSKPAHERRRIFHRQHFIHSDRLGFAFDGDATERSAARVSSAIRIRTRISLVRLSMREARLTASAITVVSSRVDEVLLREDPFSIGRAYAVGKCKREQERFQGRTDFPEVRNPERNER